MKKLFFVLALTGGAAVTFACTTAPTIEDEEAVVGTAEVAEEVTEETAEEAAEEVVEEVVENATDEADEAAKEEGEENTEDSETTFATEELPNVETVTEEVSEDE
jgi:hypothetical protein